MAPTVLRPAALDIEWFVIKGETYDITVPVLDAAGVQLPATAGYTAKAQVRRSENEPVLHEWSTAQSNLTVTTSGSLTVTLNVIAAATSLWTWTDAFVSLDVTTPDGKTKTIAEGPIHALPNRTR